MKRVVLQLDEPYILFESGSQIPLYDLDGDLADFATVVASFSNGQLILDLPDSDAGRQMFRDLSQCARKKEVAELKTLLAQPGEPHDFENNGAITGVCAVCRDAITVHEYALTRDGRIRVKP